MDVLGHHHIDDSIHDDASPRFERQGQVALVGTGARRTRSTRRWSITRGAASGWCG